MSGGGKFISDSKSSAPSNFTISLSRRSVERARERMERGSEAGNRSRNIRAHFKRSIEKWSLHRRDRIRIDRFNLATVALQAGGFFF